MVIIKEAGGGVPPDAICVHLPANPLDFDTKDIRRRRRPYQAVCEDWVKLPPTVEIKDCSEGTYLIAKPHGRYHGYCRVCAKRVPMEVRSVIRERATS